MRKIFMAAAVAALAFGGSKALAEDSYESESDGVWDVTLGAGVVVSPVSPGIDSYEVSPAPVLDITYNDRFFVSTQRGIGAYVFNGNNAFDLTAGAAIGYDFGRSEDDAKTHLQGMGEVDASPELIVFVEKEYGPFEFGAELAQGLSSDGHGGLRGELSASYEMTLGERTFLSFGPFVTFGDEEYLQSYYGVTSVQAARSNNFQRNDQDAGFESVGLEASSGYRFTDNWSVFGFAEYQQLISDVADSPIVQNEGNVSTGLFLLYSFD